MCMARFKCMNCGNEFSLNIETVATSDNMPLPMKCAKCESTWTKYIGPDDNGEPAPEPRDITADGAFALAAGNALGNMRLEERVQALEKQMKFEDCSRAEGQKFIDGRLKELEEWRKTHLDLHVTIEHGLDKAEDRRMGGEERLHIEIEAQCKEIEKRVEVLEGSYVQHNGQLLDLVPMVNKHSERLDEHDKNFKRIVTDIERLIAMVKEHIKKGFWG
jgi:DNA-directed RNA polymerase subunit RPC12/RpoP